MSASICIQQPSNSNTSQAQLPSSRSSTSRSTTTRTREHRYESPAPCKGGYLYDLDRRHRRSHDPDIVIIINARPHYVQYEPTSPEPAADIFLAGRGRVYTLNYSPTHARTIVFLYFTAQEASCQAGGPRTRGGDTDTPDWLFAGASICPAYVFTHVCSAKAC